MTGALWLDSMILYSLTSVYYWSFKNGFHNPLLLDSLLRLELYNWIPWSFTAWRLFMTGALWLDSMILYSLTSVYYWSFKNGFHNPLLLDVCLWLELYDWIPWSFTPWHLFISRVSSKSCYVCRMWLLWCWNYSWSQYVWASVWSMSM